MQRHFWRLSSTVLTANIAQAQIITGRRRGFLLACGGFTHQQNQQTARTLFWRCSDSSCCITVHINLFLVAVGTHVLVLKEPTRHDHEPVDVIIARHEMIASVSNVLVQIRVHQWSLRTIKWLQVLMRNAFIAEVHANAFRFWKTKTIVISPWFYFIKASL
jgi:hypothetical protein